MPLSWTYILVFQDSLDELEMNDYWKEVENIASSEVGAKTDSEGDGEAQDEEQQKIPEGRIRRVRGSKCTIPPFQERLGIYRPWFREE